MILELAGFSAFDRPMPGVVYARRNLVGEELPADREKLQRHNSHITEALHDRPAVTDRLRLHRRVPAACGDRRFPKNPVTVDVFSERVENVVTRAVARADDRDLVVERKELFENERGSADFRPCIIDFRRATDYDLSLSVVSHPTGLEHHGIANARRLNAQL